MLVARYRPVVRGAAAGYFLPGGQPEDLTQEGLVGLHKAIRDFRVDGGAPFRAFAAMCITRQIVTAVKMATRGKQTPLNQYVSLSAPVDDGGGVLGDRLAGPNGGDPAVVVAANERLRAVVAVVTNELSELESRALGLLLNGYSYEQAAGTLDVNAKAIDNALQRVRRKVHQAAAAGHGSAGRLAA